jgi:hypothetical protein
MFFAAASGAARASSKHDAVKGNAVIVTLGEMKNSEKFRFIADGADPPA